MLSGFGLLFILQTSLAVDKIRLSFMRLLKSEIKERIVQTYKQTVN